MENIRKMSSLLPWLIHSFLWLSGELSALIPEKVVICTICRDAGSYLPEMISQVESIGSLFQDYRVVVYENNSEDDTPSQLYRWKRANPKVLVSVEFLPSSDLEKTIVNQASHQFSRPEERALARNKALSMARSQCTDDFSYLVWLDANVKIQDLNELVDTFQKSSLWDAVFAYRKDREGLFHDWQAFRDESFPLGPELVGEGWYTETRHFFLSENDPWHPVYSAFGGLAIYKASLLKNSKYIGIVNPTLEAATKEWFFLGLKQHQPSVYRYLEKLKEISNTVYIGSPHPDLPQLSKDECAVRISREPVLVWRTHGTSSQYPEVCEHVSLHAAMYREGHRRLFINPRLISSEIDNRYESRPNQG